MTTMVSMTGNRTTRTISGRESIDIPVEANKKVNTSNLRFAIVIPEYLEIESSSGLSRTVVMDKLEIFEPTLERKLVTGESFVPSIIVRRSVQADVNEEQRDREDSIKIAVHVTHGKSEDRPSSTTEIPVRM